MFTCSGNAIKAHKCIETFGGTGKHARNTERKKTARTTRISRVVAHKSRGVYCEICRVRKLNLRVYNKFLLKVFSSGLWCILTSFGVNSQLWRFDLIPPNTMINVTTSKLTPVNRLFILEDSFTPIANTAVISMVIPNEKKSSKNYLKKFILLK